MSDQENTLETKYKETLSFMVAVIGASVENAGSEHASQEKAVVSSLKNWDAYQSDNELLSLNDTLTYTEQHPEAKEELPTLSDFITSLEKLQLVKTIGIINNPSAIEPNIDIEKSPTQKAADQLLIGISQAIITKKSQSNAYEQFAKNYGDFFQKDQTNNWSFTLPKLTQ